VLAVAAPVNVMVTPERGAVPAFTVPDMEYTGTDEKFTPVMLWFVIVVFAAGGVNT
jgi:hypothetical protein